MLLLKHCCKYLNCLCNKCTTKSQLIWRKYAWLTWSAITSSSGSRASKISVSFYFDSACGFALYVFTYLDQTLLCIDTKTLKSQHQWYTGQKSQGSGIWTLSVLIAKLGKHGQFPSFCPASFNTAHFFSLECYLFRPWLFLLSVWAGQHFQGLCNINNIHAWPKAL